MYDLWREDEHVSVTLVLAQPRLDVLACESRSASAGRASPGVDHGALGGALQRPAAVGLSRTARAAPKRRTSEVGGKGLEPLTSCV